MKSSAFKAGIVGAAALAVAASLPSPAYAINKVSEGCTLANPHGFLYIENNGGRDRHCFANAGTLTGLAIYGVHYVAAGDNKVTLWYYETIDSRTESQMTLEKWQDFDWFLARPWHKLTAIRIH